MFIQKLMRSILCLAVACSATAGNANPAEQHLRNILTSVPQNDAAREQLSIILLNAGRADAALYHLLYLSNNAGSTKLRQDAERLAMRLDGPAWGWQPIFSILPSSNANRGATGDTIYVGDQPFAIDDDSRAKNGVGLTFGASAWADWRPNEVWRGRLSGELSGTTYPNNDLESRQNLSTTLSFGRRIAQHVIDLGLKVDAQLSDGRLNRRRITPYVSGSYVLSEDRSLTARLERSSAHHPSEVFRDGPTTRLTLGWQETLSPDLRLRFSIPLATERTDRAHLDNDSRGAAINLDKLWQGGALRTSFGYAYTVDDYLGAFPGTPVKRNDRVSSFSLELSNNNFAYGGFVPKLRYAYTVSRSNVSLYDYDSHDVLFAFQRVF